MGVRLDPPRWRVVFAGVSITLILLMALYARRSSARKNVSAAKNRRISAAVKRDGIGSEVLFAERTDLVPSSVEQACEFIQSRSGLEIGQAAKDRLAALEMREIAGNAPGIDPDSLPEIMAKFVVDRLSTLTEEELDYGIETMRGFYAPGLPEQFLRGRENFVGLRASFLCQASPVEIQHIKALILDPAEAAALRAIIGSYASEWTGERIADLRDALPDQFGRGGLTPLRAFMVAYSVIADDHLGYSREQIRERMHALQEGIIRMDGQYPSPDGHYPYGVNGYFHSSPIDLLIGPDRISDLLDLLDAASSVPKR
jgi:hypothetical protein